MDHEVIIVGLILTIALGTLFTLCQSFEYKEANFTIADGIYGSVFYLATGFHGFHVLMGTVLLIVCLMRAIYGHFSKNHHIGFECAA
jgi:cytochrome c oxidase subunit III